MGVVIVEFYLTEDVGGVLEGAFVDVGELGFLFVHFVYDFLDFRIEEGVLLKGLVFIVFVAGFGGDRDRNFGFVSTLGVDFGEMILEV